LNSNLEISVYILSAIKFC